MKRFLKILVRAVVLLFILILFLPILVGSGWLEIGWTLLTGWIGFIMRVVPQIGWNWDLIGMGVVGSAFMLAGTQWFMNSIIKGKGQGHTWPWRRTWCFASCLGLTFLMGSAVVGAIHQASWMVTGKEPLLEEKSRSPLVQMRMAAMSVVTAAEEGVSVSERRQLFWKFNAGSRFNEQFHVLAIVDEEHQLTGVIVFPRDAEIRARYGGLHQHGRLKATIPDEELSDFIQENKAHLHSI